MDFCYIDEGGKIAGPVPERAIHALRQGGLIDDQSLVAQAGTDQWVTYAAKFTGNVAPLPTVKEFEPIPTASRGRKLATLWLRRAGTAVSVAVAVLGVSLRYGMPLPHWLSNPKSTPAEQPAVAKKSVVEPPKPAVARQPEVKPTPAPKPAPVAAAKPAPVVEKADSLAEWYEFGYHQGKGAKEMFVALGRTESPDRAQLTTLLINLGMPQKSINAENMDVCFAGYKDGWAGAKAARTVPPEQKHSTLPVNLQGYHKFGADGKEFGRANSAVLRHTLACTVMIVAPVAEGFSFGSGFFIGPGVICTNRHVIEGAKSFDIRMPDNSVVAAKLIAVSNVPDVALLSIPIKDNPVMRLANGRSVQVGDKVTAVGFPEPTDRAAVSGGTKMWEVLQEMEATSTFGYVAALRRKVENTDCFQVDLTINHGNSGGPTIDEEGRVIGISTFRLTSADRTNFVIKISAVIEFIQSHCNFRVSMEGD